MNALFRLFVMAAVGLLSAASACGTGVSLKINISPKERVYKPGAKFSMSIEYRNTSLAPLRLLPNLLVYPAKSFVVEKLSTRERGHVLTYSEIGLDVEQWANDVITLHPGQAYRYRLQVQLTDRLPRVYGRHDRGLYILFPVSAIALPGPGSYSITMNYDSVEHPVARLVSGSPPFWQGKISSSQIVAQFGERQ